jgi:hypothetical protein
MLNNFLKTYMVIVSMLSILTNGLGLLWNPYHGFNKGFGKNAFLTYDRVVSLSAFCWDNIFVLLVLSIIFFKEKKSRGIALIGFAAILLRISIMLIFLK